MVDKENARYAYGAGHTPEDEAPAHVEALGKQNDGDASAKSEGIAALRPLYSIWKRTRGVMPWSPLKS